MCAAKRLSKNERRNEIMHAAVKVILEKGLDHTTMEDIIAGTSLSKGGVYHYYGSVVDIFKDIMLFGIDYRNDIIKAHLEECVPGHEKAFMAKQLVDKIIDDNPYMPLYVEFLKAKKRNPELNRLMPELQEEMKLRFQTILDDHSAWLFQSESFQLLTHFINAMILAADVLEAREDFVKNRALLEQMAMLIFEKEDWHERL